MHHGLPISVVIPAYNAEAYIGAAIESVRAQTARPAEILVIDDGSSDATSDIAHALGAKVHVQHNAGVSNARNTGVRLASEPWIAFLDADDLWAPKKLESQWQALMTVPSSGLCFTDSRYFDQRGPLPGGLETIDVFRRVKLVPTSTPQVFICETASFAKSLAQVNFIVHASVIVSRELFVLSGGYDETMRYAEDLDWLLRAAALTRVILTNEPLTKIRTHTQNSSQHWDKMIIAHINVGIKISADPQRYPPGIGQECIKLRPQQHVQAGLCLLRSLAATEAKQQFRESWQQRPNLPAALFFCIAKCAEHPLGGRIFSSVRNAVQRLSGKVTR